MPRWPFGAIRPRRGRHESQGPRSHSRLHEEITADYTDMIYAATREEIETRRKAFIRKWRSRCTWSPASESPQPGV
jgi:hypothetical protein